MIRRDDRMYKKIIIVSIFLISIVISIMYVKNLYDFKSYLDKKYPDESFNVGWVHYDIGHNIISSKVHSMSDNIEFKITKENKQITDTYNYWRNNEQLNKIVSTYLDNELFNQFINGIQTIVTDERQNQEDLKLKDDINYNLRIYFNAEKVNNESQFMDISINILNLLRSKEKSNISNIDFTLIRYSE